MRCPGGLVGLVVLLGACADDPRADRPIAPQVVADALQTCIDGDPSAGLATLDTALARVPHAVDALVTRGLCYWTRADALGGDADAQRAYDDLSAAIEDYPGSPDESVATPLDQIYSHRAFAARRLHPDDWRPTLRDLDRAVEVAPGNPLHVLDRGVVHRARGDTAAARADLHQFLALTDSSEVARRQVVQQMLDELEPVPGGP